MPYNKILVPLDGSKRAERILPYVEELAQCLHSKVIFLQVIEFRLPLSTERVFAPITETEIAALREQAESYLAGIVGGFGRKHLESKSVVAFGQVVDNILSVAEHEKVDLVAMTSHGRSGIPRVFYGSVAAGVLQRIDRPLLVIRSRRD